MSSPLPANPTGPYRAYTPKYGHPPETRGLVRQKATDAVAVAYAYLQSWLDYHYWRTLYERIRLEAKHPQRASRLRTRLFTVVNLLILVWLAIVYYSERTVFKQSIEACEWGSWESWPSAAKPHRVVLIADPQLVDPHTYPGRPWPLSSLTVRYTDLYLQRTYTLLQEALYPDSIFFLGDLFDGGREWSTSQSNSPEKHWRRYGEGFWLKEYNRFGRIFFRPWHNKSLAAGSGQRLRRIIASLPGNHDLGFGTGIQKPVRDRFIAYLGNGNRIDIFGNHTFVSLDTVSLSARDAGSPGDNIEIWRPTLDFLEGAQESIRQSINAELSFRNGSVSYSGQQHIVQDAWQPSGRILRELSNFNISFPTMLLTHVPLYRSPGTPCGPLREHWPPSTPPSGDDKPVEVDHRNAISVSGGYQYQNVLTPEVTQDIIEKVGRVDHVFSGDDHDYCEVLHQGYPSAIKGIREITVKSLSWAMGVRKPGFLMLSLWNPIDEEDGSIGGNQLAKEHADPTRTMQSHLCLLPDQLGIFIRYALLLGVTLALLAIRAALASFRNTLHSGKSDPILPIVRAERDEKADDQSPLGAEVTSKSSTWSNHDRLSARIPHARGASPLGGYGLASPAINGREQDPLAFRDEDTGMQGEVDYGPRRRQTRGISAIIREFKRSVWQIARIVLLWYAWLLWNG